MSSRSKLSVLVRSGRRGERADRRRPECDEVAAVVRNVQRLDWSAPRDIQERDRAVPQLPSRHERPRRDALDVHHAPDRTGHPRPDCPHKRICLETPLPLSDGCKRPERLLVDSRSGRGAAAPPGPSCPGVLHRNSVGAPTQSRRVPSHGLRFRNRLAALLTMAPRECCIARRMKVKSCGSAWPPVGECGWARATTS